MVLDKRFLINFSWLNAASITNKLISFVYVVILVRLLPQASYGVYNLVWAQIGLLGSWQDLGTTPYGLLQGNSRNAAKLNSIFTLRIILAFVVAIATLISAVWLNYATPIIKTVAIFSGFYLYTAISGFFLVMAALQKRLTIPAILSIAFNTVLIGSNIFVLILTKDVFAVFKITALYYFIYGLFLLFVTKKYFFPVKLNFNIKLFKQVIRQSLVFTLISFSVSFYLKSNFIMIGKIWGPTQLAIYSAAYKFFEVPQLMVANYNFSSIPTFRSYFIRSLARYWSKVKNDTLFLLMLSLPITIFTWIFGGFIINLFFSNRYSESIQILNILIIALPMILLSSVFISALYAQRKEKMVAVVFIGLGLFNFLLNLVLLPRMGINITAWLLVITQTFSALFFGVYLHFTHKHGQKN